MVIPIFPRYLEGRPQATPSPPFPFPNCYHWVQAGAEVRVRARPGGYDEDRAVKNTIPQHIKILRTFTNDYQRMEMNEMAFKEALAIVVTSPPVDPVEIVPPAEGTGLEDEVDAADEASLRTSFSASSEEPLPDIFGFQRDPNVEVRIPLVDLWSDLENHLSADTITDPREFDEEARQVQS